MFWESALNTLRKKIEGCDRIRNLFEQRLQAYMYIYTLVFIKPKYDTLR